MPRTKVKVIASNGEFLHITPSSHSITVDLYGDIRGGQSPSASAMRGRDWLWNSQQPSPITVGTKSSGPYNPKCCQRQRRHASNILPVWALPGSRDGDCSPADSVYQVVSGMYAMSLTRKCILILIPDKPSTFLALPSDVCGVSFISATIYALED